MSPLKDNVTAVSPFQTVLRWDPRMIGGAIFLGMVLLVAVYVYISQQFTHGLGVTGLNRPTYWGLYIINFIFFIGLSAGGIIIASLVHAFGIQEFRSVARIAELMAISCLLLAVCFILLDLGRPDRLLYIMMYPHPTSPLSWDVTVVNIYLIIGLTYGYFGTRADLVRLSKMRPKYAGFYRFLALGYLDLSPRAEARDRLILKILAVVGLIGAVALHTVTAWILGLMKARPGWFGAIMAPLFIVSATVSGLALLLVSVVFIRRFLRVGIGEEVIRKLGVLLAFSIPVLGYFLFAEMLTVFYSAEPGAMEVFEMMIFGPYAITFWGHLVIGMILPMFLLAVILTRISRGGIFAAGLILIPFIGGAAYFLGLPAPPIAIGGALLPPWVVLSACWLGFFLLLFALSSPRLGIDMQIGIASMLVVLGVLAERWNIVVPSLIGHSFLPIGHGAYLPTGTEVMLVSGVYALGGLFFIVSATILPLVESEGE